MRLDKYLKVSRIIKRRTVAIEITFGTNTSKYEVLSVQEVIRKENAQEMYKVL